MVDVRFRSRYKGHLGQGHDSMGADKITGGHNDIAPNLDSFIDREEWTLDALCAQVDHDIFFPEKGGSTREPKAICARCPVTADCLEYALERDERFGVWGGLSERERRRLNRDARCPDCGKAIRATTKALAIHRRIDHPDGPDADAVQGVSPVVVAAIIADRNVPHTRAEMCAAIETMRAQGASDVEIGARFGKSRQWVRWFVAAHGEAATA